MAARGREKIKLESVEGDGHFYTTTINRKTRTGKGKLKLKKYNPKLRKHVFYEEKKISR